jgi:carbamoyl-phosphate synthase large subunit
MNILLTCAGRRNYLVKYFREALGHEGCVCAADMQLTAPALVDAQKAFKVPSIYNPNYIESIIAICIENDINAVLSLNDLELPILSQNEKRFAEIGVRVVVSSEKVIDICFDKFRTTLFAEELGINTPLTYKKIDDAQQALSSGALKFPLILKPRWGSASIGIEVVYSEYELELAYKLLNIKLSRTILAEASKENISEAILIQEFIDGDEFGLDIVNDLNGNYCATIVKKKLAMRAGETDKAVTVNNMQLVQFGELIGKSLKHIGNLDCDFFISNGKCYLLELNSRFGGGYPFSHEAGANIPKAIINWLKGEVAPSSLFAVTNNSGFSKYDNLMRIPTTI